jgi:hypothetical protein
MRNSQESAALKSVATASCNARSSAQSPAHPPAIDLMPGTPESIHVMPNSSVYPRSTENPNHKPTKVLIAINATALPINLCLLVFKMTFLTTLMVTQKT